MIRVTGRRALLVTVTLVALALVAFARARSYVLRSPASCTNGCHADKPKEHFASKGHGGLACQACHTTTTGVGLRLLGDRTIGKRSVPKHGAVTAASCTSCHVDSSARWARIADTAGHRRHPSGTAALDCLSCHRETSHQTKTAAATCLQCHANSRLHAKGTYDDHGQPDCLSCHNFSLATPARSGLTTEACGTCHSSGAKPADGASRPARIIGDKDLHGGVDCKLCHDPHAQPGRRTPPCKSCHHIEIGGAGGKLPEEHFVCEKCHEQHRPLARAGSRCANCHEQARARNEGSRSTALRHDECASCHLPHSWTPAPNGCVGCHGEEATLVFTKSPVPHRRCTNCHEVHGAPISGTVCGKCHEPNATKMRAGPPRHQICTSCHSPHSPEVEVPTACTQCHKTEVRQVVTQGPARHASVSCTGCHTLHGNPKAETKVCGTCHQDKTTLVAKAGPAEHKRCDSCHAPHTFSISQNALPCPKCHSAIATSSGSHMGSCVRCHTPHGSPQVPRERCIGCHQTIDLKPPPNAPEHSRCGSCHIPHRSKAMAVQQCGTCHADKASVAQTWPAGSAHRDACNHCHQPHDVRTKTACGNCHADQQRSATGGKHQCTFCHNPHQSPPPDKSGWWNRCQNCHAKEASASKQHNQCNNCHKPHQFKPPECVSCHADMPSKAAHAVKQHQDCTRCHDAHEASLPGRKECLSCHTDRAEHQPTAQRCNGCHLFK